MSSFPKALTEISEADLSEESKLQRDKLLKLGYDIKHLILLEDGEVIFDPELSDYDAFTQSFEGSQ
jgi:hypothetical protein